MSRVRIGVRHLHLFMAVFIVMIANLSRVNLSIALVAMTDKSQSSAVPSYNWNEGEKSAILSSLFWGIPWLQIISGTMIEKYGSKSILALTLTIQSLLPVLIPYCASIGYQQLCVLRMLQGIMQGSFYPGITVLLSKWMPPSERSNAITIAYGGGPIGILIMLPLGGYLASTNFGWPSIFYFTGGIGFICIFLWLSCGASTPSQHSFISEEERDYIESSTDKSDGADSKLKTPWKHIWRSKSVWAMMVAHVGQNWCFFTLLSEIPNYVNGVTGVDIRKNGLLSALPYACASITIFSLAWMSHKMQQKLSWSKTKQCKFWNSIGMGGSALCIITLGILNSRNIIVIVCVFNLALIINTAVNNGFMRNHVDMSPNFCGTLMGITISTGHIGSILGTMTSGWIVVDRNSTEQWMYVFILMGTVMFVANLFFVLFGSSEIQSWNNLNRVIEDESMQQETFHVL